MRLLAFIMIFLCGCIHAQSAQSKWVEEAISVNNDIVRQFSGLQDSVRAKRKAAMIMAANTVGSMDEGKAALDEIESDFQPLFDLFVEIERVQNSLADALRSAREALKSGGSIEVKIEDLVTLYSELQSLHSKALSIMGEL